MKGDIDRLNKNHWRYNTKEDVEFYKQHRIAVNKLSKESGPNIPFRDLIEDPGLTYLLRSRTDQLSRKANDLRELLSLECVPSGANANPYYDNSLKVEGAGAQLPERNAEAREEIRRKWQEDDAIHAELVKRRKEEEARTELYVPDIYDRYGWLSRR